MKEKNLSLELVKFIAVITVANHWMGSLYGKWSFLATGGAIGDALFFFASGFTIFMGRFDRYDNWYKRRIRRIIPSVIAVSTFFSFIDYKQLRMSQVFTGGDYWFIKCIFIYYVFLYLIRKYFPQKPFYPIFIYTVVVLLWYLQIDSSTLVLFDDITYIRWACFFIFMLLGAYLGNQTIIIKSKPWFDLGLLVVSVLSFYGILYLSKHYEYVAYCQILCLIPLAGVVLSIYKLCTCKKVVVFMHSKFGYFVRFIAGLCLETYLINSFVIKNMEGKLANTFPLNVIITFLVIIIFAYLIRCMSRVYLQIFDKDNLNWKEVFRPV